jgi:4-phospho-D-threonate 3-dehydrogenase / 4-phospho-D-erythronate 3-dehydrogenase
VANRILGITMGDSSGVGPEILLKSWSKGEVRHPAIVYGDLDILAHCNEVLGYGVPLRAVSDPADLHDGVLNVIDHRLMKRQDLAIGKVSALSGRAAREYVVSATQAALAGQIAAMVTLPMNKEATQLSDPGFIGHTELIGSLCGSRDVTIMLASDKLIVTHVSTHVSLAEAIQRVKKERICAIIELTVDAVKRLRPNPRIAVAGLNPHAGEHGLFGQEEILEIAPAVAWAKDRGMPVDGPFAPDTLFYQAVCLKRFDAIVCMYHDQGHVVLKLLDFDSGVNVTLGLPIIRTSVDHGTAFDIAWTGVAKTANLIAAIEFAAKLCEPAAS